MANIQLKSFTAKASPVPADLIYAADSANSFDEVQITIAGLIGAYPGLLSIGSLTTAANEIIYTTGVNTFATAPITAFGLSVLALSSGITTPTAGALATWDANGNLSANNFLDGLTVIVSAAGTTTLTVASTHYQLVNGSTTQTIILPVVATLVKGQSYYIINTSSGVVTVQSSGLNNIQAMAANTVMLVTFNNTAGTAAASWTATLYSSSGIVIPVTIAQGGTGVTSVTISPTASAWAGWDANSNLSANNFNQGYATTATAAGTTTLTVASAGQQYFTGATTQTVLLPVTSTLVLGQNYLIVNNSSGAVTVQSSGGNTISVIGAGTQGRFTVILTSGTSASSWNSSYNEGELVIPVTVAQGGSGQTSFTAYGIMTAGITTTGAMQQVTPSTSGFLLQSGGAAGLPTFTGTPALGTPASGILTNTTAGGGLRSFQVFTSGTAQTYTKPANVTSIMVEVIGGGGGGGGSAGGAGFGLGGGGGSGGYARLWIASAASTYTYTVGAGGAGGAAGVNTGTSGGTTTFSASSLQATGGTGGVGGNAGTSAAGGNTAPGAGGVGSNGNINAGGEQGTFALLALALIVPGQGGSSIYGGGGLTLVIGNGGNAQNYGSGGGGGASQASNQSGGNGSGGLIVVWEFS
jgi:hypothetical protein